MKETLLLLAIAGLSMTANAQVADATDPFPTTPPLNGSRDEWDLFLGDVNVWLRLNGPLLTNTNDSYTINGDWSMTRREGGVGLGAVVNAGSSPALEFENYVWANTGGMHPTQNQGSAYAHERWNTSASYTHSTAGTYEYEFRYWGGPQHKGKVENIEAWYEFVGVARAYNSDCGAYAASTGRYADSIGPDLTWSSAVAAEAGTNVLPIAVGLQPPGGGPTVSVNLSTSTNGVAIKWDIKHRGPFSKIVKGTPANPGIVLVQKEMTLDTHAEISSFIGWAGPAQAGAILDCCFSATFTEV